MKKLTLSVPEAGKALGIGRTAAYEAARTRQLPTIRIGKRLLVPVVALERLLTGTAQPAPGTEHCLEDRTIEAEALHESPAR